MYRSPKKNHPLRNHKKYCIAGNEKTPCFRGVFFRVVFHGRGIVNISQGYSIFFSDFLKDIVYWLHKHYQIWYSIFDYSIYGYF